MAYYLKYRKPLYLGDSIHPEKLHSLKKTLRDTPMLAGVYLITYAVNERDQLDIYPSFVLWQKLYAKKPPYVVGIAADYAEAISLVEKIASECVSSRGDGCLKSYLMEKKG